MPAASLPWIKLYAAMLDDPRIGELPERACWRYIQLMLLAGLYDAEGYLVDEDRPLDHSALAWRLRVPEEIIRQDLDELQRLGLLVWDQSFKSGGAWCLQDFSESQGRSQTEQREIWRRQKQRQRIRAAQEKAQRAREVGAG